MGGEPACTAGVIGDMAGIGERGEGRDEDGTFGGLEDPGIAVINGAIEDGPWKSPSLAVVVGSLKINPPEGADMLFPAPGANHEKLAVGSSGQGWPTVIEMWQLTDGFYFKEG